MIAKQNYVASNPIADLFEDQLHTDLFNARCHDTGETTNRKLRWIYIIFSGERQTIQRGLTEKECEEFLYSKPAITPIGHQRYHSSIECSLNEEI
jgi:hypothetical protein